MSDPEQPTGLATGATRTSVVVHHMFGSDMVVETFDDGTVHVNGDRVTPAGQVKLDEGDVEMD